MEKLMVQNKLQATKMNKNQFRLQKKSFKTYYTKRKTKQKPNTQWSTSQKKKLTS